MTKPSAVNIHRTNPPDWFKQADFGIIIHWGPYSVPAYAPVNIPDYGTLIKTKSLGYLFEHQPYAEWYGNSMLLPNSPVAAYHRTHYGNTSYADFAKTFKQTAQNVDVQAWAEAFANAGAKYVVIVTKHHDGFVMFDPHLLFIFIGLDFPASANQRLRQLSIGQRQKPNLQRLCMASVARID